ncbi:hypothetical protein IVB57_08500 [Bradyrhizobium sp. CW9]|uniref:alpha/beta hydrolase family protein n=1 Tax=Bradyrhizobium sp. CW9 TaxID=2782689 RepID=UPI001FFACFB4|nr:hypothetical protein [Bradyrhizobium sp. CW9]MCK1328428.1 hypothetical protein [Bradyrhizobium sp. CW9]
MNFGAWPLLRGDLASARCGASAFLDSLSTQGNCAETNLQNWSSKWTATGDTLCDLADLNIDKRSFDEATEAWLSALTAFEVARRLVADDDRGRAEISAKVEAAVERFGLALGHKAESIRIPCFELEIQALFLPAGPSHLSGPAVICISSEEEAGAILLGRLLPVVIGRGMSVLVVSHEDLPNHSRGQSEILLSWCLDYLSTRPDIDHTRIAVYGDGLSAVLATDLAAKDRRVAAAVCEAGIWTWTRRSRLIGWMTSTADEADADLIAACQLRSIQRLKCPILVVAGGRSSVAVSEAIRLHADCLVARIDLELAMPQIIRGSLGEGVDNFVASDECIFRWLDQKLAKQSGTLWSLRWKAPKERGAHTRWQERSTAPPSGGDRMPPDGRTRN